MNLFCILISLVVSYIIYQYTYDNVMEREQNRRELEEYGMLLDDRPDNIKFP